MHVDPNLNFIVESSAALAAADVGLNVDVKPTAAAKVGGLTKSNMQIDASTKAVTATLPFRIVGLVPNEAGEIDGKFARVRLNATTMRTGAKGV